MGKLRLETGEDNFGGREKRRGWKRKSTDDKYREVEDLFGEKETPLPAKVLHIGSRLPKDAVRPKSVPKNNKPKENKPAAPAPENSSAPVSDAEEPLPAKSDEEKLAGLEEEISGALTSLEQKFAKSCLDDYPEEIKKAINKIESNGSMVTEKKISAIRTSYIGDVKRWGLGRQLAPEKAELLEKYLELKLPVGIPEEKVEIVRDSTEETKEINFTPEQMEQIRVLLGIAVIRFREYYRESVNWGSEAGGEVTKKRYIFDQMKKGMENVIRSDQTLKNIFPEEKISEAVEKTMELAEIFNIRK